jgi:hypothetical protein
VTAPDQLCVCPVHCTPGPAGKLREATARVAAARYAAALIDGEDIDGEHGGTDYEFTRSFAAHLPEALHAAGFSIHARLEAGRVINTVRRRKETT